MVLFFHLPSHVSTSIKDPNASMDRTPPPKPVRLIEERHRSSSTEAAAGGFSTTGRVESSSIGARWPGNGSDTVANAKQKNTSKVRLLDRILV